MRNATHYWHDEILKRSDKNFSTIVFIIIIIMTDTVFTVIGYVVQRKSFDTYGNRRSAQNFYRFIKRIRRK